MKLHYHCKCGKVFEGYAPDAYDVDLERVLVQYLRWSEEERNDRFYVSILYGIGQRPITDCCPSCHHENLEGELIKALKETHDRRAKDVVEGKPKKVH